MEIYKALGFASICADGRLGMSIGDMLRKSTNRGSAKVVLPKRAKSDLSWTCSLNIVLASQRKLVVHDAKSSLTVAREGKRIHEKEMCSSPNIVATQ